MILRERAFLYLTLLGLFLCAGEGSACNIPVFRYALERWPGDPYDVVIFHRGPLGPKEQALIARMEKHAKADSTPANLAVEVADVDKPLDKSLARLYEDQHTRLPLGLAPIAPELPRMVVRFPVAARNDAVIWSGPLGEKAVGALLDSPIRREMVKRLAAGETAVWLLLESGNETQDNAASKVLQDRLSKLKTLLKLPELTNSPDDKLSSDGPALRIAFSLIRIARDNPDEQMLIRMLLHSEDELLDRKDPIAFPIFGRGRALWALAGKGINEDTIDESGAFLVGPCSCQVKRMNPGTDLLIVADWDSLIEARRLVKTPETPPLQGLSDGFELLSVPPRLEEAETSSPAERPYVVADDRKESASPPAAFNLTLLRNIGLGVVAGIVILGAYALVLRSKNGH